MCDDIIAGEEEYLASRIGARHPTQARVAIRSVEDSGADKGKRVNTVETARGRRVLLRRRDSRYLIAFTRQRCARRLGGCREVLAAASQAAGSQGRR